MNFTTPLRALGYAVLPSPRHVELTGGKLVLSRGCRLDSSIETPGLQPLTDALQQRGIPCSSLPYALPITITIAPHSIETGYDDDRANQAYRLQIGPDEIRITGQSPIGAFYGIQTLIQLIESAPGLPPELPLGTITDWPDLELRFVHWDSKHHRDRIPTLIRFIDEMARFKLNAVSFELEEKFEYPSHPVIGSPGAFTTDELISITRYALERHIQIVPNVQAPAHLSYVLKHPEFAHLRCDGSNYMICMDEPEARQLLFSMYDDLCKATPGVRFFHVSTDEVYYAGICGKFRPYTPENRSLTLIDYINAAHAFLKERGRRVLIWAEFPILTQHLHLLPPDIIDGVIGGDGPFIEEENRLGIRQLAYSHIHGEEQLFPSYFPTALWRGKPRQGRLDDVIAAVRTGKATRGCPIGTFPGSWDDSGPHNETFCLGWATMAQCGWQPSGVHLEQTIADFMDVFYGCQGQGLLDIYKALHSGARYYENSWDILPSVERGPAYGGSKGKRPIERMDLTLFPPTLPLLPNLALSSTFRQQYAQRLSEIPAQSKDNDALIQSLLQNLTRVTRNRYSLEVMLSLAWFMRHHLLLLAELANVENDFALAADSHTTGNPADAIGHLNRAADRVQAIVTDQSTVFAALRHTWEKSRLPRNAPVNGRHFLHVMDDVKNHFADRRPDLSYLTAPEDRMKLQDYLKTLKDITLQYGRLMGLVQTNEVESEPPPME